MKKVLLFSLLSLISLGAFAQKNKTEVLYFKAQLPCCQASSCNNLEQEIKQIIEKNYPEGNVVFKQIALSDSNNKELVEKHNAKSQTVVVVNTKKKKESSLNLSDVVRKHARSNNKDAFEKELTDKINEFIK